jgi:hypothetical protein
MHVLINQKGELVAATTGPIGSPEDLASHVKAGNGQPVAFITAAPGHNVREVDVPDRLIDAAKTSEFHQFVLEAVGR